MLDCQRHLFSLPNNIHYLNNAYKAPLLKSGEAAALEAMRKERNPTLYTSDDFFDLAEEVKSLFAQLINTDSKQISFIPSVSYGFASILHGFKGKTQGHAITIKNEFPSGYFALQKWCSKNDNQLLVISPEEGIDNWVEIWNEKILANINEETSVVLISSVHWMDGVKFDLKAIGEKCKKFNAKLLVDGTQSIGALPFDLEETPVDALVCGSYKWLMGTYSLGIAYFGEAFQNQEPIEESWMNRIGSRNFSDLTNYSESYQPKSQRFNMGETSNFILMPIVKAGQEQILNWQPTRVQKYAGGLKKELYEILGLSMQYLDENYYSNHLFDLKLPFKYKKGNMLDILKANNVFVSVRGESIRVSINVFNNLSDINALISSIEDLKKKEYA